MPDEPSTEPRRRHPSRRPHAEPVDTGYTAERRADVRLGTREDRDAVCHVHRLGGARCGNSGRPQRRGTVRRPAAAAAERLAQIRESMRSREVSVVGFGGQDLGEEGVAPRSASRARAKARTRSRICATRRPPRRCHRWSSRQSWFQAADSGHRLLLGVDNGERRPPVGVQHARTADARRSAAAPETPRVSRGPTTRTRTTASPLPDGLDAPVDGVLGGVENARRHGAPADRADARRDRLRCPSAVRRPRPAHSRLGVGRTDTGVRRQSTPTSSASSMHGSTSSTTRGSPVAHMGTERREVRRQQLGHVRVQGVLSRRSPRAAAVSSAISRVQQRGVELGDAVSLSSPATTAAASGRAPAAATASSDPGATSTPARSTLASRSAAWSRSARRTATCPASPTTRHSQSARDGIGEGDVGRAGRIVDRPRQHRAADLEHRRTAGRATHGAGAPQSGVCNESHPAACSSEHRLDALPVIQAHRPGHPFQQRPHVVDVGARLLPDVAAVQARPQPAQIGPARTPRDPRSPAAGADAAGRHSAR